jgi:hypothetical protein
MAHVGRQCQFRRRGGSRQHRVLRLRWPKTASPRTAAVRSVTGCEARRQLGVSQRNHACRGPPEATAAVASSKWASSWPFVCRRLVRRQSFFPANRGDHGELAFGGPFVAKTVAVTASRWPFRRAMRALRSSQLCSVDQRLENAANRPPKTNESVDKPRNCSITRMMHHHGGVGREVHWCCGLAGRRHGTGDVRSAPESQCLARDVSATDCARTV